MDKVCVRDKMWIVGEKWVVEIGGETQEKLR